jgi:integrase
MPYLRHFSATFMSASDSFHTPMICSSVKRSSCYSQGGRLFIIAVLIPGAGQLALTPRRRTGSILAVHVYIQVKLLTGMRRGDLLRLTIADLMDDGIHVTPHKTAGTTGKQLIIRWSTDLQRAVHLTKDARQVKLSPFLFCNRRGDGHIDELTGRAGSWDSMWNGFVKRVLVETKVKERLTEHDLRAKCASDAATLEHTQALLGHASSRLTDRVYRRKARYVMPLR